MKRAVFAIASVGIVATAVGVEAANAQYAPAPPAYTAPPAYGPSPTYTPSPRYTRRSPPTPYGGPGYGYGPGPYFVCQAVGARSVGYGRAYFVADAKWQALIRCERYSGICIISYCVRAS
jgi:hypothetical protein